jgi:hypothetical protein
MRQHFEYYIDDNYKDHENTILYGKAIMIALMPKHKNSWTKKERQVFFLKDTLTFKELGKMMKAKEPTIFGIHKNAIKKLGIIIEKLLTSRKEFNKFI